MKIGKQSTLNDLSDLKTDLEAQIEEVKAIKVGEVSQIEEGEITSGSIFDERPSGVYHVTQSVDDKPLTDTGFGMLMHLDYNPNYGGTDSQDYSAGFYVGWGCHMSVITRERGTEKRSALVLTTMNTITDANGFIKAA